MSPQVSRNPADYEPDHAGHFRRRLSERKVPGVCIKEAIESGRVSEQTDGKVKFTTTSNPAVSVVVNPTDKVAVTVYWGK